MTLTLVSSILHLASYILHPLLRSFTPIGRWAGV
jgi:hypothetical protein